MAITAGGIGSGIDVDGLVRQLVAAEGQPAQQRLAVRESRLQADLSAYGSLKNALSTFQTAVKNLQNPDNFLARRATSSNSDLFSATADKTAVAGSYSILVDRLAEAARVRSGDFTSADTEVGTGSLAISLGDDSFSVNISAENNTLAGIRDAINAAADNPGITASIINVDGGSRLILSSNKVGAGNDIAVAVSSGDAPGTGLNLLATDNLQTIQAAQDAVFFVDGQQVTRGINSISDVIQGVTFNLKKADADSAETLTVALDTAAVRNRVNTFVSAYNTLVDTMNQLSAFNPDSGQAGPLLGDSVLRGVQSQVRQALTSAVEGLQFGTLAEVGITTTEGGRLSLDGQKFDEVLNKDFSAISQLFASDNGIAKSLSSVLDRYVASDGILNSRTDGLQSRIKMLDGDRERLDRRLESLETRYRAQFTAMDILVGQLQGLSGYLEQQLSNLPQPNSIGRRR